MSIEKEKIIEKMNEIASKELAERHSLFQLKYFVIGKEPTVQAQLWRCIRELKARKDTLDSLSMDLDESKDQLELINLDISELDKSIKTTTALNNCDNVYLKKMEIQLKQKNRKKQIISNTAKQQEEKIKNITEEISFFVSSFESLEKIEKLKNFDDLESQTDYWDKKLSNEINLKLLLSQPLDIELVKTALALDNNANIKKQIVKVLQGVQKKAIEVKNDHQNIKS